MEDRLQDAKDNKLILMQKVKEALNRLIIRAPDEVLEYGTFPPISEEFINNDPQLYCRKIYLTISHPPSFIENYEIKRYFDVKVKTPSDASNASCRLAKGNKTEILSHITVEGFSETVLHKIIEMARELETDKFA